MELLLLSNMRKSETTDMLLNGNRVVSGCFSTLYENLGKSLNSLDLFKLKQDIIEAYNTKKLGFDRSRNEDRTCNVTIDYAATVWVCPRRVLT